MNHNSTIIDSRNKPKKEKRGSFVYLIFAVLCSVVLWFYVAGVDTDMAEKKFTGVAISLENASQMQERYGYSVLSGYDMTADITVTGRKSDISRLKASDVNVWADLSTVGKAGENKLAVQADLPDGMTLSACYPQSITVYTDEATTKSLTVEVRVVSMTKGDDLELSEAKLDRERVNVSGPSQLLENLEKATVSLDLGNVTTGFEIRGSVVLQDKEGNAVESPYLRCDTTEVTAKYSVYKTKQVPLSVEFLNGYLASDDVSVKITPATLQVRGEPERIDSLSTLVIRQFDETLLKDSGTDVMLSAQSLSLPEGVTLDDPAASTEGLHVYLRLLNSSREMAISLNQPEVSVIEPAGLNYTFNQELLAVELRGTEAALTRLNTQDLKLSVDLSNFTTEGIKPAVPVKVLFDSGREAYVVGEYFVSVTLSASQAQPEAKT